MVDSVGSTQKLHRTVLSWDYWDVSEKLDAEGGVFDKLRAVPATFSSMKVWGSGRGMVVACMQCQPHCQA